MHQSDAGVSDEDEPGICMLLPDSELDVLLQKSVASDDASTLRGPRRDLDTSHRLDFPFTSRFRLKMIAHRCTAPLVLIIAFSAWISFFFDQARGQDLAAPIVSSESVIHYTGSAPLHSWTGTSETVQGLLLLDVDTPSQSRVSIRAPVASFQSGPDRRDQKMHEVTEAEQYPYVRFRATDIQPNMWGRSSNGHAGRWTVTGELTFHGQTNPVEAPVEVRITDEEVRAHAEFDVSLQRFGIDRPELFWVAPIADTIHIEARIMGVAEERPSFADRLTEDRIEATGTRQVASDELRDLESISFSGERAGLQARVTSRSEDEKREWGLAFYGFSAQDIGMAEAGAVSLRADQNSIEPLRVEGTTRQLDDGTIVEIKRLYFSRSDFETIAEALTVSARIGDAQFSVGWNARADMRLLLEEVSAISPEQVTSRDDDSI